MRYPFLTNNELVLVDYVPGSAGHLLLRLWSELDSRLCYDNPKILTDHTLNSHKSSREVDFELPIPKRITNWFLNKCKPKTIDDYANYFEFFGTFLFAAQARGDDYKFYADENYKIKNHKILYGIHSWHNNIPIKELQELGYNIKYIAIIAKTEEGKKFQYKRGKACYPLTDIFWNKILPICNDKNTKGVIYFDFCTLLATKNTQAIINWLRIQLGDEFRTDKIERVTEILEAFYSEIVDNL
jgi:hypothetical protein